MGVDESSSDLSASSANFLMQCIRHTSLFSSLRKRYLVQTELVSSFDCENEDFFRHEQEWGGGVSVGSSPILADKGAVLEVWKFKESKDCLEDMVWQLAGLGRVRWVGHGGVCHLHHHALAGEQAVGWRVRGQALQ